MENLPHDSEEYKRQMAQRRKNNTIALLGIGVIIVILVAFSGSTYAVFGVIGIFIIVGILVVIRSWLERRYQRRKAEERAKGLDSDEKDSV